MPNDRKSQTENDNVPAHTGLHDCPHPDCVKMNAMTDLANGVLESFRSAHIPANDAVCILEEAIAQMIVANFMATDVPIETFVKEHIERLYNQLNVYAGAALRVAMRKAPTASTVPVDNERPEG